MAFDVGAEITVVARALNRVRVNGAALVASATAAAHGRLLADRASKLPGEFLRGSAGGAGLARSLRSDVTAVERGRKAAEGGSQIGMPVNPAWWAAQRHAIERIYIDGAAVYAAEDAQPFRQMTAELGNAVVAYGEKLAKAGAGAPGVLLGDVLHAVGGNVSSLTKGAGEGVSSILGGLFSGLKWPLLIIGGVLAAAIVFTPPDIRRAAVGAASRGLL